MGTEAKENMSQPAMLPASGQGNPKEVEEDADAASDHEHFEFYTPLGEHDLEDLPLFAYQISQGMVSGTSLRDILGLFTFTIGHVFIMFSDAIFRSISPPWVSSTVTWPAATSWWMRGSCSRYQTLVSHETLQSTCPPSRTRCH